MNVDTVVIITDIIKTTKRKLIYVSFDKNCAAVFTLNASRLFKICTAIDGASRPLSFLTRLKIIPQKNAKMAAEKDE